MSESSDVLGDQDKELRRRNVNLGTGDFSDTVINKTSNINNGNLEDSDKDNLADNDVVDSDHVRYNKLREVNVKIFI